MIKINTVTMEKQIEKILKNCYTNFGEFDESKATKELLNLFSVSGSFTAYDVERAYDDGYQTEGKVNFDIENYR